jgi:hypothetical protein
MQRWRMAIASRMRSLWQVCAPWYRPRRDKIFLGGVVNAFPGLHPGLEYGRAVGAGSAPFQLSYALTGHGISAPGATLGLVCLELVFTGPALAHQPARLNFLNLIAHRCSLLKLQILGVLIHLRFELFQLTRQLIGANRRPIHAH